MIALTQLGAVPNTDTPEARKANLGAFARAQAERPGERIELPSAKLYFAGPIHLTVPTMIVGDGMLGAATLVFPAGSCGVVVDEQAASSTLQDFQIVSEEAWNITQDVTFDRAMRPSGPATDSHGLVMHAPANVFRLGISGFGGHGISAHANILDPSDPNPTRGNASGAIIIGGRIERCGRRGIDIGGGDANGIVTLGVIIVCCGEDGLHDDSLAGGLHLGNQITATIGRSINLPGNGSLAIGNYAEGDCLDALVNAPAAWMGPASLDATSTGMTFDTAFAGAGFRSPKRTIFAGMCSNESTASWFRHGADTYYHSWKWDPSSLTWGLAYADSLVGAYVTGASDASGSRVEHPRGTGQHGATSMLLGDPSNPIRMTVGDDGPPADGTLGDIHYARTPLDGWPHTWRCFTSGWKVVA